MPIRLTCECGKILRMPETAAGRRGRCPACGHTFVVPTADPLPVDIAPTLQPTSDPDRGPLEFADDPDSIAAASTERAAAERRRLHALARAQQHVATVAPQPVIPLVPISTGRPYRYLILLLTLLPLVWSTFLPGQHDDVVDRVDQTLNAHPEARAQFGDPHDGLTKHEVDAICAAVPEHKIVGALLPYDTWIHWGFAALTGAGFFGIILLVFPTGHTTAWHLLLVGLFTGTLGILLLLALQWLAFHMPLFRGSGMITLLLDLIWLIGLSYRMALSNYGFFLSALGFTAGVGFCEEACKALPLIWKARVTGFYTWRSAMIWGLVSGIGFGVSEAITYSHDYYNGVLGGQIYLVRFISCVGLHGIWAAATGINVYRRQDYFRSNLHPLEWVMQVAITVIVPMILHGLYDTMLKQHYDVAAIGVALASFGWLAFQVEMAKRKLDPALA